MSFDALIFGVDGTMADTEEAHSPCTRSGLPASAPSIEVVELGTRRGAMQ